MNRGQVIIFLLLIVLLIVPFAMSRREGGSDGEGRRLIVVTPHVPQILEEFNSAFGDWHERVYGEPAFIDSRRLGGTSDIRRALEAQYRAAMDRGEYTTAPDGEILIPSGIIGYDLMFGGGSYDHGLLKTGISATVSVNGEPTTLTVPMSVSAGFSQAQLDAWYGPNKVGPQTLYDPDQFWLGAALSSFGIVYNTDQMPVPPTSFDDLTDPALTGRIALADPRQSGSITTTFDSILGNAGWDEGWRILRGLCANTRYFTNSSTKPPIDVSQGEAAAGLAIDFYGRGQAQVVGGGRVGYAEPKGAVYIDADPISILRGGPDFELAQRFVEFSLTEEGQALWQFPATSGEGASNPMGESGEPMGPNRHALRRMPVRRVMYEKYFDAFIDRVDPFELVSDVENPGWRTGVQLMMGCFAIDIAEDMRAAWRALHDPDFRASASPERIAELETMFYAFPTTLITRVDGQAWFGDLSDEARSALGGDRGLTVERLRAQLDAGEIEGTPEVLGALSAGAERDLVELAFTESTYRTVRNEWRDPKREADLKIAYTKFFRGNYRMIIEMANEAR